MPAERAIEILDSAHDLIGQMSLGRALGLHLREFSRRTRLVVAELPRPDAVALNVVRLRAAAAWYATRYVPPAGASEAARAENQERLNAVITALLELRAHLQLQIGVR